MASAIVGGTLWFLLMLTVSMLILVHYLRAWDHEPTEKELRDKLGETWG